MNFERVNVERYWKKEGYGNTIKLWRLDKLERGWWYGEELRKVNDNISIDTKALLCQVDTDFTREEFMPISEYQFNKCKEKFLNALLESMPKLSVSIVKENRTWFQKWVDRMNSFHWE